MQSCTVTISRSAGIEVARAGSRAPNHRRGPELAPSSATRTEVKSRCFVRVAALATYQNSSRVVYERYLRACRSREWPTRSCQAEWVSRQQRDIQPAWQCQAVRAIHQEGCGTRPIHTQTRLNAPKGLVWCPPGLKRRLPPPPTGEIQYWGW